MRRAFIIVLATTILASLVSATDASTVTMYLVTTNYPYGSAAGTWQLYADVSHDNDGLANYDIDVVGTGGASISSTIANKAPEPNDPSTQYADGSGGSMGFNSSRSNGTIQGTNRVGITAAQDTVYATTDDPTYDMGVLVGVGQEPASASPQNGSQGPTDGSGTATGITPTTTNPWAWTPYTINSFGQAFAGTLIEQGTYTTNLPAFSPYLNVTLGNHGSGFVEVLGTSDNGMNEPWTLANQIGNTPIANFVVGGGGYDDFPNLGIYVGDVPEPASIGLLIIGAGILGTRCHVKSRDRSA